MPIYAYRCESCGHAKDVLQKMSDPVLSTCPACGAETFKKQVTAAGFQLKGSGWYVTDFRGGNKGAPATGAEAASSSGKSGGAVSPATSGTPASAPASTAPSSSESSGSGGGASTGTASTSP